MTTASTGKTLSLANVGIVLGAVGLLVTGVLFATRDFWFPPRAQEVARARYCQENLNHIKNAKELWRQANNQPATAIPNWSDLVGATLYLKRTPVCPGGGTYKINDLDHNPECSYAIPSWLGSSQKYQHRLE